MINKIGRKIYYDKITGNVVQNVSEVVGIYENTTVEQDFLCFESLRERVPETVGLIQLEFKQLEKEFNTCSGYRIDITANPIDHTAIIFSYDQPLPEPQPPTVDEQTLERVQILEEQNLTLMMAQAELYELITLGGSK